PSPCAPSAAKRRSPTGAGTLPLPDALPICLWPGDDHAPDWIMFNAYGSAARPRYADNVQRFYEKLATDAWFPAAGRPWGVREWGDRKSTRLNYTHVKTPYAGFGLQHRISCA